MPRSASSATPVPREERWTEDIDYLVGRWRHPSDLFHGVSEDAFDGAVDNS
jgi:hypothetical protein